MLFKAHYRCECNRDVHEGFTLVPEDSECAALNVVFMKKRLFTVSPLRKASIDTTVMSVLTQPSCSSSNNTSLRTLYMAVIYLN